MSSKNILTTDQVRRAVRVDPDYPAAELEELAQRATSFIQEKTGHDFTSDDKIHPLAQQCAALWVRQQFYNADGYNPEYDFTLGINGLLADLQNIARRIPIPS